jgi:alpha-aminoadipic semialdehyde synthase
LRTKWRWLNIGIRREDKSVWEARAPLAPEQVKVLQEHLGVKFIVQPSHTRIFSDADYGRVGDYMPL